MRTTLLAVILALGLAAPANATTQTVEDPSDAPAGGAVGKADLRSVTWDVTAATASVKVSLDESTFGGGQRADIGVELLLDTNNDSLADKEIVATRSADDVKVDVKLRDLNQTDSTLTCQKLGGKDTTEQATVETTVADGLETFTFQFNPAAVTPSIASFKWVAFGQAPPGTASTGPWDYAPDAANPDAGTGNPGERHCGAGKTGFAISLKDGVTFTYTDPQPTPTPTPTPSPTPTPTATPSPSLTPPSPPIAVVVLAGGQPPAGTMATLDARGTQPAPGARIVAYRWDLNGDGRYETNTGTRPIVHLLIANGTRTVGMQAVDNTFATGATTITITAGAVAAACDSEASVGVLRITAACIRRDGDDLVATPGPTDRRDEWTRPFYAVGLNGATLLTHDPNARIRIDRRRDEITGNGIWKLMLLNGPQGDIEFYESSASGFSWPLPSQAGRGGGEPAGIISLELDDNCQGADEDGGFITGCATVPGNFPLNGRIDVGIDTDTFEFVIDANVSINVAISVTGRVRLRGNIILGGIVLDGIGFGVEDAEIGVLTLHHLRFDYEPPGGGTPPHEGDMWDVALSIEVAKVFEAAGRMIFVNGRFNYLRSDITFTPGILVYPAVFLNRFAGEVGLDPTRFGGGIGASFASLVQVNANWLAAYLADGTAAIRMDGTASVLGVDLASAYSEIWTNGLYTFGGEIGFNYPNEQPQIRLSGGIDFWAEAQRDNSVRFQAATNLTMRLFDMYSERTQVFVNNEWIVGCIGRFTMGTYNWATREVRGRLGCDTTDYTYAPTLDRPALRPPERHRSVRARISQAGPTAAGKAVRVGAGERALVLDVTGQGGTPSLMLTDPEGRNYFPTDKPAQVVRDGGFASAYLPAGNVVLLRVDDPIAGEWIISPLPGSVAIDKVGRAAALPPLRVTARVSGRGRKSHADLARSEPRRPHDPVRRAR